MIELTRLNGNPMVLNSDLIKTAEASPDTMLTLINGEKLIVREDMRRSRRARACLSRSPAGHCGAAAAHLRRSAARCRHWPASMSRVNQSAARQARIRNP